jgi:hypothetical protein
MDTALVVITLASLGTTSAVLFYAARLIRDERARSQARVAVLAEEIGRAPADPGRAPVGAGPGAPLARSSVSREPQREPLRDGAPATTAPTPVRTAAEPRRAPRGDARADAALHPARHKPMHGDSAPTGPASGRSTLFESASTDSPSNSWLVPVIGAMIVVLALATIYFVSGQPDGGTQPARAAVAAGANLPLELVSLAQARKGDILTVSGTVRNPAGATERRQVAAVVFVFDRNGSFVASGRAPLDFQALAPGDDSPFVITVPGAADVSRYRVSFREGDDVLPHVDRREPADGGKAAGPQ